MTEHYNIRHVSNRAPTAGGDSTDEDLVPKLSKRHQDDGTSVDEAALFKKLNWRLLPLFWLMVCFNYIDRTNLAFAAIQLKQDLGFTGKVYGLGSGLFFVTYASLQIPSNILLRRFGGPIWLALIVASWGMVAISFAFMHNTTQFYVLRTLLGVAEAGAFPGMWYMLSKFYPQERITLAFAVVESGIALSNALAAPVAAGLLSLDGMLGVPGWRWLFLLEGIPSLCLAVAIAYMLPASPDKADMLTPAERSYLTRRMTRNQAADTATDSEQVPLRSTHSMQVAQSRSMTRKAARARGLLQVLPSSASVAHIHSDLDDTAAEDSDDSADVAVHGGQAGMGCAPGTHSFSWCTCLTPDIRLALATALTNKYVWYMGCTKIIRDIAGNGILFFGPMIIDALITGRTLSLHTRAVRPQPPPKAQSGANGHRFLLGLLDQGLGIGPGAETELSAAGTASGWHGRSLLGGPVAVGSQAGILPALLTSLPFGLAAMGGLYVAHRSQLKDERIMHTGIPLLVAGLVFQLFPYLSGLSTLAGFACLCVAVVGVNCVGPPILALVSEQAAGPGLVVALPLFNSIGNTGGFVGPFLIGWILDSTNSFAWPTVLIGWCLIAAGLLILAMPRLMGLPDRSSSSAQLVKPK